MVDRSYLAMTFWPNQTFWDMSDKSFIFDIHQQQIFLTWPWPLACFKFLKFSGPLSSEASVVEHSYFSIHVSYDKTFPVVMMVTRHVIVISLTLTFDPIWQCRISLLFFRVTSLIHMRRLPTITTFTFVLLQGQSVACATSKLTSSSIQIFRYELGL